MPRPIHYLARMYKVEDENTFEATNLLVHVFVKNILLPKLRRRPTYLSGREEGEWKETNFRVSRQRYEKEKVKVGAAGG
jgi:hypothetical protein